MEDLSFSPPCKRMKRFLIGLSCCNQNSNYRDWSALPGNLLLCISNKLTHLQDYLRFGDVCPPWRSIFYESFPSRRTSSFSFCRLPLLLIPHPTHSHHTALYSLSTQKVCHFPCPVPRRNIYCGSSLGWLVTLDNEDSSTLAQLHNPFLNTTLHLPPLPPQLLQHHPNDLVPGHVESMPPLYNNIWKAVLSSDPLSSPNDFLLMAIISHYRGLAFYKSGNATWTPIGELDDWYSNATNFSSFDDIIFFHKTNQFYALDHIGQVFSIDLSDKSPKLTLVAPTAKDTGCSTYIVEDLSSGDLFQVHKDDPILQRPKMPHFTVFKLDFSNQRWIEVDDIGDNVMFLGNNASLLRAASECPGCDPNCIYYTNDDEIMRGNHMNYYGHPKDGIYNLKYGTVRPHYSKNSEIAPSTGVLPQTADEIFNLMYGIIQLDDSSAGLSMLEPPPRRSATARWIEEGLPQLIWIEPTLRGCSGA